MLFRSNFRRLVNHQIQFLAMHTIQVHNKLVLDEANRIQAVLEEMAE
jgi:hypothetical protein